MRGGTYKAVAFGTASEFVGDDDCLQDITVLDEMIMHCFFLCNEYKACVVFMYDVEFIYK